MQIFFALGARLGCPRFPRSLSPSFYLFFFNPAFIVPPPNGFRRGPSYLPSKLNFPDSQKLSLAPLFLKLVCPADGSLDRYVSDLDLSQGRYFPSQCWRSLSPSKLFLGELFFFLPPSSSYLDPPALARRFGAASCLFQPDAIPFTPPSTSPGP